MARTFYISRQFGDNSLPATSKSIPWRLVPGMNGFTGNPGFVHQPDDIFILKGGETWPLSVFPWHINMGGNASVRTVYKTDPTWYTGSAFTKPVFDFGNSSPSGGNSVIFDVPYVTIDGFIFYNQNGPNDNSAMLYNPGTVFNVTGTNLVFSDWANCTAALGGGYDLTHCEWTQQGRLVPATGFTPGGGAAYVPGMLLAPPGRCTQNVNFISYSRAHHVGSFMGGSNGVFHDNEIGPGYAESHPGQTSIYDPVIHCNAFQLFQASTVYNNLIHDLHGVFSPLTIEPTFSSPPLVVGNSYVYNNVIWNVAQTPGVFGGQGSSANPNPQNQSIYWFNNITVGCQTRIDPTIHGSPGYTFKNLSFQNNLTIGAGAADIITSAVNGTRLVDHNLVLTTTQATNFGMTVNSLFYPNSSSPTINAGTPQTVFNTDRLGTPRGSSWDIGAYEFTSGGGGTGVILSTSPSSLDFGSKPVGDISPGLSVVVTNTGDTAANLNLSPSSPFQGPGNVTVPAFSSSTITFLFRPTVLGNFSTNLAIGSATLTLKGIAYPVMSGLSFAANAGVLTSPMTDIGSNHISQSVATNPITSPLQGGRASYGVPIPADGDYTVSIVVDAPGDANNSLWINFTAEPTDPTMIWDVVNFTTGYQSRDVSWRGNGAFNAPQFAPKIFTLTAGTRELVIRGREANLGIGQITVSGTENTPVIPPPPAAPTIDAPANNATGVSINTGIGWVETTTGCTFGVYFGTTNPPPQVASDLVGVTWFPPAALAYSTTYYWKIQARKAWSSAGQSGTVTTDGPVWSFTTVPITPPPNQPPNSGLSSNKTSGVGPLAVTFTLTSSDPDGTVASGVWDNGIDPPETINTPAASVTRNKTYPASVGTPTVYNTSWIVTDDDALDSTTATIDITVSPTIPVNQPPNASITANQTAGYGPFQVTFTLTASDPDGTVTSGILDYGDGTTPVTLFSPPASRTISHTYAAVAVDTVRTVTWQTTDNSSATSTVASVAVTVRAAIIPPTIILTTPAPGTIYTAPATISFAATAAAGTYPIANVEFYIDGVKVDEDATAPYTGSEAAVAAGDKVLTAKVLDNQGSPLIGTSQPINVHVMATGTAVVPKIIYVSS